jgi:hypothetical protein
MGIKERLLEQVGDRLISVEQLPQEEIALVCQDFSITDVYELILEQIPYPSKDPSMICVISCV